jgi:PUA domain protein
MPKELRVRRRARLRNKDVDSLVEKLSGTLGIRLDGASPVDSGDYDKVQVYISEGRIVAFRHDDKIAPSLRLALKSQPTCKHVTVDMGAIKFVCNGADVMGPGVVDADASIKAGDVVWVREQTHMKPLAIGIALADGVAMPRSKGKVVQSLHYVGDSLWEFED